MEIILTYHAIKRATERFGWNDETLRKRAIKSIDSGISALDDEILRSLFLKKGINTHAIHYLMDGVVFVWCDNRLVTVYNITGYGTNNR